MLKKLKLLLSSIISLLLINPNLNLMANSKDFNMVNSITNRIIQEKDLPNLEIVDYEVLYDIELNPSYLYIKYNEGYVISSRENGVISELNLEMDNTNYDQSACSYKIYGGPFNYICQNSISQLTRNSDENFESLIQRNNEFLALENSNTNLNSRDSNASFTNTIPISRMQRYATGKWINNTTNYPPSSGYSSVGICGTIAAAGLLAYYDDYVNNNYVPDSIRTRNASTPEKLITTLFTYIDKGKNGTIVGDVKVGVNKFLTQYSSVSYTADSSILTFSTAKTKIDAGKPVCVGMLSILGSPSNYGDHWVLAYQYKDGNTIANDYYKVVDNHGAYTAEINVLWTSGLVYLTQ